MAIAVGSTSNTPTYGTRVNSVITAPSGIANGDLLIAVLHVGDSTALPALTVTPPAGWTEVTNSPSAAARADPYTIAIHVYWKVAASESGNYTFTHTSAQSEGFMYRLTGADTSTPIDATPVASVVTAGVNGTTTGYASITTVTNGVFLLFVESDWDAPGAGAVSGTAPTISVRRAGTISWIGDGTQTTAGTTTARTRTNGNDFATTSAWASLVVPIRQAAGAINYTLIANAGALTLAGPAVNLLYSGAGNKSLPAGVGLLTLSGQAAALKRSYAAIASTGTLTLSGQTAALKRSYKMLADLGTLTLSGKPAVLSYGRNTKMAAGLGSITMLAPAVGLVYSQSTNKIMPAGIGFIRLDGQPVTFKLTYRPIACGLGTLTLAGQAVSLRYGRSTGSSTGTLTLSGQAVTWKRSYGVRAQPGVITLSGDAALTRGRKMTAAQGAMTLTGQAVLLKRGRGLGATTGVITLSGQPVNLNQLIKLHRRMQAVPSTIYLASPWVEMGRSGTEQPGRLIYGQTVVLRKW